MCSQFENQLISKFIYRPNGILEAVTLYDFIEIAKNSESIGNIFTILLFSYMDCCVQASNKKWCDLSSWHFLLC